MHTVELRDAIEWEKPLEAGSYLAEDHNAAGLLWAGRGFGGVRISHADCPPFDPDQLVSGSRILVVRVGGFGDMLWLVPLYRQLRARGVHIFHCCFDRYRPVLENEVDGFEPYPLPADALSRYDQIAWLENLIEGAPCTKEEHPSERMAKVFGLPAAEPCAYSATPEEQEWARLQWPRTASPRIAVQPLTSTPCKDYTFFPNLLPILHAAGYEILIMGSPRPPGEAIPPRVYDATQKQLTIRQSLAILAHCDIAVSGDSIAIHAAAALGVPVVGLFGPFEGKTYMKGYRGIALQGDRPCSPCHWHPRGSSFPPEQKCAKHNQCLALNKISPEFISVMVKRLLENPAIIVS